ncbi:ejaculatory bulb-specific protein 3 isoform X2 [Anastrepha obliqua]|nr:ejaculatory bulb-specific protein 3 [Anastrepha ludens]XP_053965747.1 ejaculatory bulb-specific protein 3 [Anastrepha ludens]XP_053965748.1 ejaculatory bulb-specific protein 3 [Anastrepha ludens]XP_053965749.1 ejaculatory bulb-specific protein 3 [Anastrepha ludens]XP_053965751.1 ejaculatory bulb-specific protein 3 [Anastrepha ludens]XP_054738328.1 ejaculatory bulb-specific protein 3 isoform X2 [Anastrepha obliqua]XP_054738329.1 ejaculatory bulb-specific protein 3 isoform X2 [Anastrepha obl
MKAILVLLAIIAVQLVSAQKQYTNKFDNVDVDGVLSNNRILTNYIKCLMDKGPCTPEGRELKKLLPDALQSECSKCTETQRKNSQKVINFLRANRPGEWKLLLDKYDSKGVYRSKYEKQG